MLKNHKKAIDLAFRLLDGILIIVASIIAYMIRFKHLNWDSLNVDIQFHTFVVSFLLSWIYFSSRWKLYSSKRYHLLRSEIFDLVKTIGTCSAISFVPAFFIRQSPLSRLFLIYFVGLSSFSMIFIRIFIRKALKFVRLRGYNYRVALIIGRNCRSALIASRIVDSPEFGVKLLGFIDSTKCYENILEEFKFDVLGDLDSLEKILRDNVVDEVFVTLPIKSFYDETEKIIKLCEDLGVEVKIPIDLFNKSKAKSAISTYQDIEVIDFYTSPQMNWQIVTKRIFDFSVSLVLLFLLLPCMAVIAVIIKVSSQGPAIFKQKRMGYNGRVFNCYKFRTMICNAEELKDNLCELNEMEGPVFKIRNDPRVTKIGKFLRKTSIDELPQLVNVIKGDMSLVGPRPPIPEEVCKYQLSDRRRLSIKPGITCTWQVSGRNSVSFEEWMKLDQKYIDEWSLLLDLRILLKTIPAVLLQKGAQ
jgi:exopolysaccharide biosynthesis polyprenyl glycosylphosphotransferase